LQKLDPEWVAASFIGNAADVHKVRKYLSDHGNSNVKIISKVERPIALKNIDDIIEASDAVMVARGDLGVEIPTWEVPIAQKMMVKKCNIEGKPVIVATQMLESMTSSARPTRAEASDVFNAVLDGADAVMLSGETSVGKYPIEAVKIMKSIIDAAENYMPIRNPFDFDSSKRAMTESMAHTCYDLVQGFQKMKYTGKIIVIADSGYTAKMVSKFRPSLDIIAMTNDIRTSRELNLVWGVRSVFSHDIIGNHLEERLVRAIRKAFTMGFITPSDHVIMISRSLLGKHVGSTAVLYNVKSILELTKNS